MQINLEDNNQYPVSPGGNMFYDKQNPALQREHFGDKNVDSQNNLFQNVEDSNDPMEDEYENIRQTRKKMSPIHKSNSRDTKPKFQKQIHLNMNKIINENRDQESADPNN